MTNYEAILKMNRDRMERFLDQVYLSGVNIGTYAASNNDDSILDDNPFDAAWLADAAEAATAVGTKDGDEYVLNALVKAVLINIINPNTDNQPGNTL